MKTLIKPTQAIPVNTGIWQQNNMEMMIKTIKKTQFSQSMHEFDFNSSNSKNGKRLWEERVLGGIGNSKRQK